MPYRSQKQKRFFYLVKAAQQGKVSPKRVGSKVAKAARTMSAQDVDDFTHGKDLPKEKLKEITNFLKELVNEPMGQTFSELPSPKEPMYLQDDSALPPKDLGKTGVAVPGSNYLEEEGDDTTNTPEANPVAKTFQQKGNFEQYIQRFSGLEIKPKEMDSITNYTKTKPTKVDKYSVRYENTDEFNNSTITVIKKLREGNDLVFTVFQSNKSPEAPGAEKPKEEEDVIIVTKSISFRDEIEGGSILSNLLQKLEI